MKPQVYEQLTLFPVASHDRASRSALLGSKEAVQMTVISGQKCCELSKRSGPVGCLERMLLGSSIWNSTMRLLTWKAKVTKQQRLYYELAVSVPRIKDTELPLWATPNTMDSLPCRSYEAMMKQATNGGRKNRKRPGNLREQVNPLMNQAYKEASRKANGFWPTPTAADTYTGNLKSD